jgi:hypothetical protein
VERDRIRRRVGVLDGDGDSVFAPDVVGV